MDTKKLLFIISALEAELPQYRDNWDELKAELNKQSLSAKEIADDVQQTFDCVTNEYRQILEDRILNLINQNKLPDDEEIYQWAIEKAKGFERETLARQCFFDGAMWLKNIALPKEECNCVMIGLGTDKYYNGDCDIHKSKECPQCLGSGKAMNIKYDLPCQRCNGKGEI